MHLHLKEIEEYAGLLMLPNDIADILEVDRKEFIDELNDANSYVRRAFNKGYLKTEVIARKKAQGGEDEKGNIYSLDVEEVKINSDALKDFKAKLTIQLYA